MSEERAEYAVDVTVTFNETFDEYQAVQAINASSIAYGRKSMLHMHHAMTTHQPATPAMMLGTLAHYAVLEGGANIVCCDARRGSKDWQAAVDAANGNERMVCKADDYERIMAMRDAVMAHKEARWIIQATKHEVSLYWQGIYGAAKMRADMLGQMPNGNWILADYKTTADIEPHRFFATAERLAYHIKMGWYFEGVKSVLGKEPDVYLIVQEAKAPYDVFVCKMPRLVVIQGRDEAEEIAMQYRAALQSGFFTGVAPDEILEYERPSWTLGGDNAEISMEGVEE